MKRKTTYKPTLQVRTIIQVLFAFTLVSSIVLFVYYQSEVYRQGPVISVSTPQNGETFHSPLITIQGTAHNISYLKLNDRQIYTNENRVFEEKLLLLDGYNIITIEANDRFGRSRQEILELVYIPQDPPGLPYDTPSQDSIDHTE
jgi:hypothetical protein